MKNYGTIIYNLDMIMKRKNISKNKLSELTGISFSGIQRYFNGTNKRVDLDVLARLCAALECNVGDILDYQEPNGK